jgi:hypothetical protein
MSAHSSAIDLSISRSEISAASAPPDGVADGHRLCSVVYVLGGKSEMDELGPFAKACSNNLLLDEVFNSLTSWFVTVLSVNEISVCRGE